MDRPDCTKAHLVPSFTRLTARSAIPFVCGLCGVHVSACHPMSFIHLLNSGALSVYICCGMVLVPKKPLEVALCVFGALAGATVRK